MIDELPFLALFFENPSKEYAVRECARLKRIAPATASKYLKRFAKQGILKFRKERMLDFYRANLESSAYRDLKIYYTIRKVRESGLLEAIDGFYLKPTVILFGSCSNGYDTENSDIDLVIISEKSGTLPRINSFEKKLNKELQVFAVKKLDDLRNAHLIQNVLNGIVLQGELRWTWKSAKGKDS